MGHLVTMSPYLSLGGTSLAGDGTGFTPSASVELPDDTCFGDTNKQRLVSLKDYQLDFEANLDFADDALDEDLEALVGTNFAVAWRAVNATVTASNPEYQFTGSLSKLTKNIKQGEVAKVSGTIMLTTSAGVTRALT